ncbi:hypothetical protein GCM10007320_61250 [Pseudorhodoferax aquiterrae]|uniref:Uncharacterized protein n=1 Tax=Pseudorhodoferax aquiterrae TaxID=747304 RepID=A0ABQ3GEQ8_9BURK|nr:hypothetical protein [Pseudorhodoferax aquiterrae]GHD02191.1 hypothetical protein GCM10007320_61250 [Pseudorhodoferax aquiterrae]
MNTQKPGEVSRRRLAKGAAIAPVVLSSLLSKRALGNTYLCTVSGQVSGNMSPNGNDEPICAGTPLATYVDQYKTSPVKFKELFGTDNRWHNVLLKDILQGYSGPLAISGSKLLAQRAAVAYLNASKDPSYYVNQTDVRGMFIAVLDSKDYIRPSGGTMPYDKADNLLQLLAGF